MSEEISEGMHFQGDRVLESMIDGKEVSRLRQALGLSQAALAKLVGVSQPTITALENGEQRSFKRIAALASALKVGPEKLDASFMPIKVHHENVHRSQPMVAEPLRRPDSRHKVPVYASAEGGGGALILSHDPIEWEDRPPTLEGVDDAYMVIISGESMVPAYKPGERAWVDPRLGLIRDEPAIFYFLDQRNGDQKVMIKEFIRQSDTHWYVRQFNPAEEFAIEKREWPKAHRVIGKFTRR